MNYLHFFFPGAYTPVTMEGNIVVDKVLASCYALASHDLGHFATVFIRWFPKITQWIFGENNGSPGYINIFEHIATWAAPHGQLYISNVKVIMN